MIDVEALFFFFSWSSYGPPYPLGRWSHPAHYCRVANAIIMMSVALTSHSSDHHADCCSVHSSAYRERTRAAAGEVVAPTFFILFSFF